ncbi:hypothetical protein NKJ28_31235 [Mesorhizobium sp. M0145]|uniref:hypothetical protein n=1 Tax=Mesorhizobium sp. M0145 TaxID=2956895 RepID=UPI0033395DE6
MRFLALIIYFRSFSFSLPRRQIHCENADIDESDSPKEWRGRAANAANAASRARALSGYRSSRNRILAPFSGAYHEASNAFTDDSFAPPPGLFDRRLNVGKRARFETLSALP